MATATMEGSLADLMKNVQVKDAVDMLDSSLNHDVDFDNFASDSSLQVHAAVESTPVSHDPTCTLEEEVEAENDPELVIVEKEEAPAPTITRDRTRFVTPKDFELLKVIGMGAFGKVLQVRNKQSKQIVAMKVISKRLLKRKSGYIENVQAERDIMTKIRHPFVVTMHCSFQTRDKLFIIMDFLAGGELFLRLGREGIFLEKVAAFYLAEIILALDHLHTHGVLHRDLKPENILMASSGHICLTDFGLAKDFSDGGGFQNEEDESRARTICGTQEYMAPEMIARKGYGRPADYWSLGCIAYEMLSGLPPFTSKQGSKELFRKIMSERVKMPPGSTAAACKLLKGLLNRNVTARLGASRGTMFEIGGIAALKQVEFFKGMHWEKLERMEIDPPDKLAVDNDEDLRHFHDEFTKMPLPRSVTEMSMEKSQPRRCESDMFRGFSFVQEDFHLPHRNRDEVERYWTHVEEDGESLSECASSKFDFDEVQEPVVPEKKKRPPRKRKKKAAASMSPMPSENGDCKSETTSIAAPAEPTETTPVAARTEPPLADAMDSKNEVPTLNVADTKQEGTTAPTSPQMPARQTFKEPPKPKPPQKPKQEEWQSVGTTPGKQKENPRSSSKQSPAGSAMPRTNGNVRSVKPQGGRVAASSPVPAQSQQTRRAAPGSWAAKTTSPPTGGRSSAQLARPSPQGASQQNWATQRNPPPGTVSPSGDWRKHRMVPASAHSQLPPPPIETTTWPSLGDFPIIKSESMPTSGKTSTPKGVWARTNK